jgi:hypothetical protein
MHEEMYEEAGYEESAEGDAPPTEEKEEKTGGPQAPQLQPPQKREKKE